MTSCAMGLPEAPSVALAVLEDEDMMLMTALCGSQS